MSTPKRILFFTNSDYGQANVVLATAHALMRSTSDIEIHIASFPALQDAVRATSDLGLEQATSDSTKIPLIFHSVEGTSWGPASFRPETGIAAAYDLKPGLVNSAKCVSRIPAIMLPWTPDEFLALYHEAERIMGEVHPDLTVVEPLFTPALTLCHHIKTNWIVLAPNTIKDFAVPLQPGLAMLWKYPLVCSAMPYPLPLKLIPRNIALNLVVGYALVTDSRIKGITQELRSKVDPKIGLMTANELGVLKPAPPGLRILVANSPDLDYPFTVLPKHVIPCGPIVRAAAPVASVDPSLAAWLTRAPTVFVNLGTQLKASPAEAEEMAHAFKAVLARADAEGMTSLQILWKVGRKREEGVELKRDVYEGPWKILLDILGEHVTTGRVRVTDWVTTEPKAVLESGNIVCSVNHGGASSFFEAICAGVPQVLLPPWSDCYDFGNRVEILGVGCWANQIAKPRWEQKELAAGLEKVLFGPESASIRAKAKEFSDAHKESAGRQKAATEILAELSKSKEV